MSKTDKKPSDTDKVENPGVKENNQSVSDSEGVDKIRELIFGAQMADYEKKFSLQEKEFLLKITELREDTKKWNDTLEMYIKKEIESLSAEIKKEKQERTENAQAFMKKYDTTNVSFQKTIDNLSERSRNAEKELRQQLLDQSKQLRTEMHQTGNEIHEKLEQAVNALKDEKTDRKKLSLLLMEVALQLNSDIKFEDMEKRKNE